MQVSNEHSDQYLICDARFPLISNDVFADELMLYNISTENKDKIIRAFETHTGKRLYDESVLDNLSGGQKVLLMLLLSIYSSAKRIHYYHLYENLDKQKRIIAQQIVTRMQEEKELVFD